MKSPIETFETYGELHLRGLNIPPSEEYISEQQRRVLLHPAIRDQKDLPDFCVDFDPGVLLPRRMTLRAFIAAAECYSQMIQASLDVNAPPAGTEFGTDAMCVFASEPLKVVSPPPHEVFLAFHHADRNPNKHPNPFS